MVPHEWWVDVGIWSPTSGALHMHGCSMPTCKHTLQVWCLLPCPCPPCPAHRPPRRSVELRHRGARKIQVRGWHSTTPFHMPSWRACSQPCELPWLPPFQAPRVLWPTKLGPREGGPVTEDSDTTLQAVMAGSGDRQDVEARQQAPVLTLTLTLTVLTLTALPRTVLKKMF